jgi:hypothetical protein
LHIINQKYCILVTVLAMTGCYLELPAAPYGKRPREYLATLRLYTGYDIPKITRLLNKKFQYRLDHDDRVLDQELTAELWERLTARRDKIVLWAYALGPRNWRVKRVKNWALEQEEVEG